MRPLSLSSSAAASSPRTSASWVSSCSSSPRSWPRRRARQRLAVQLSAAAAQYSTSPSPSPCTLLPVSSHSSTVPSPLLPAAEERVCQQTLCLDLNGNSSVTSQNCASDYYPFMVMLVSPYRMGTYCFRGQIIWLCDLLVKSL